MWEHPRKPGWDANGPVSPRWSEATDRTILAYNCPAAAAVTDGPLRVRFQPDVSRYTAALYDVLDKLKSGNVDALAGLIGSAGKIQQFTGAGTMQLADYLVFNFRDDWAAASSTTW
ncbi:MAG: hypothetical protein ACTHJQ_05490 [Rhizobiaceae bacterium]